MVRGGPDGVNRRFAQHPHQVHSICLQNPLLNGFVLAQFVDDYALLGVLGGVVHVYLGGGGGGGREGVEWREGVREGGREGRRERVEGGREEGGGKGGSGGREGGGTEGG